MTQHTQSVEQGISDRDLEAILRIMDSVNSSQYHYDAKPKPSTSSTREIMPSPLSPPEDMLLWGVQNPGNSHLPSPSPYSPADLFCRTQYSPMTRGLETGYLNQTGGWHRVPENSFNLSNQGQPLPSYLSFIPEIAPGPSPPFYAASPYMSNVSTPFHMSPSRSTSTTSPNLTLPCLLQTPALFDRPLEPSSTLTATTQSEDPLLARNFQDISQKKERDLLVQVLNSEWLAANHPEPLCMGSFDGCERTFDRQDRAVAHIRRQHLKYKPYACGGACGKSRCHERFANMAYQRGHINKTKGICYTCGKELTRKNLPRHSTTCGNGSKGKFQRSIHDTT